MEQYIVLEKEDVINSGIYFDGDDVHWGGEYGQQVCQWAEDGSEIPISGLIYETRNERLVYYCQYENGIPNGHHVIFNENGKVKKIANMYKGVLHGKVTVWRERHGFNQRAIHSCSYRINGAYEFSSQSARVTRIVFCVSISILNDNQQSPLYMYSITG